MTDLLLHHDFLCLMVADYDDLDAGRQVAVDVTL